MTSVDIELTFGISSEFVTYCIKRLSLAREQIDKRVALASSSPSSTV